MAVCPNCAHVSSTPEQCPRCGVIYAKFRGHPPASPPPPPRITWIRPSARQVVTLLMGVGVLAVLGHMGLRPWHFAPRASYHVRAPLELQDDPRQEAIPPGVRPIVLRPAGQLVVLEPVASYALAGRVVAEDAFYLDAMAHVAPVDLTVAWGRVADPAQSRELSFDHFSRFGAWQLRPGGPLSADEVARHVSNNHLIPATDRIRAALLSVDVGDRVALLGSLVDVSMTGGGVGSAQMKTSRVRDDTGAGACEIIYVTSLRIGDAVYE